MCQDCCSKLAELYFFKEDLIAKQEKLIGLLADQKAEIVENGSESLEAVKIETDLDLYKNHDAIEYDMESGELQVTVDAV